MRNTSYLSTPLPLYASRIGTAGSPHDYVQLADLGNLGFSGYLEKKLFMINYKDYITIDPAIRFGRPCLKGTRISVYDVLNWLANGMSFEEIQTDFPELTETHIRACLAYAADREHKLRVAV